MRGPAWKLSGMQTAIRLKKRQWMADYSTWRKYPLLLRGCRGDALRQWMTDYSTWRKEVRMTLDSPPENATMALRISPSPTTAFTTPVPNLA